MPLTKKDLSHIKQVVEEVSSKQTDDLAAVVSKEFDRLDGRIDKLDGRIDGFEKKMDDGFAHINEQLDSIDHQLAADRNILKDHEGRITALEQVS